MAAPFGFSAGDFVAGITLLVQATQALRASSTATADCQAAAASLESVQHVLERVDSLDKSSGNAEDYESLVAAARACHKQVVDLVPRIKEYATCLADVEGGRKSRWRRTYTSNKMKLLWTFEIKKDVKDPMAEIGPQLTAINMHFHLVESQKTTIIANQLKSMMVVNQQSHAHLQVLVTRLEPDTVAGAERKQDTWGRGNVVRRVRVPSERLAIRSERDAVPLPRTYPAARSAVTADITSEQVISILVLYLWQSLYQFVRAMSSIPMKPTFLLHTNIHVQDALGRSLNLPYEHFRHWPVMKARLEVAFAGCPGQINVQRSKFALFAIRSSKGTQTKAQLVLNAASWDEGIRCGQKFVMSMSIEGQGHKLNQCPRCGTTNEQAGQIGWSTW
ncbi:hypothetical protein B0A55_09925 [Friedmanniomyces simplex]|uniref:Ubiquitin-like domain-containing protein n=1 Tax=Friedmanniomyces simplex TaxID=329884 RepID=A0A4U0WVS3_9PEZI|nr:hypothetical protein B0A55_09925 [Friedmanniomyces simplex]